MKQIRKDKGLTQDDVADAIHKSRSAYARLEEAKSKCSIEDVFALAKYLETDLETLLENKSVINVYQYTNLNAHANTAHIQHISVAPINDEKAEEILKDLQQNSDGLEEDEQRLLEQITSNVKKLIVGFRGRRDK